MEPPRVNNAELMKMLEKNMSVLDQPENKKSKAKDKEHLLTFY